MLSYVGGPDIVACLSSRNDAAQEQGRKRADPVAHGGRPQMPAGKGETDGGRPKRGVVDGPLFTGEISSGFAVDEVHARGGRRGNRVALLGS